MRHAQRAGGQERFLEAFRETGIIRLAATAAGVGRASIYRWQEHDEAFAAAFAEAEVEATERLEALALERAGGYAVERETVELVRDRQGRALLDADGAPRLVTTKREYSREYSDKLLMLLLRARAPEKYRERLDVTTGGRPLVKAYAAEDLALLSVPASQILPALTAPTEQAE